MKLPKFVMPSFMKKNFKRFFFVFGGVIAFFFLGYLLYKSSTFLKFVLALLVIVAGGVIGGIKLFDKTTKKIEANLEKNAKKMMDGDYDNYFNLEGKRTKVQRFILPDKDNDVLIDFETRERKVIKRVEQEVPYFQKEQEELPVVEKSITKKVKKKVKKKIENA